MRWNACKKILGLPQNAQDLSLEALTHDGRVATAKHLFMPLKRSQGSLLQLVEQALAGGCGAILVEANMAQGLEHIPKEILAVVPDFSQAMALIYPLFYPGLPEHRVAITGTDGKTSTAHFLHQLWNLTGVPNANIGTMGLFSTPALPLDASGTKGMTTPAQPHLYALLSACKQRGNIDHVVFEASSHALAQGRLDPLRVHVAMMTNFAQDHLDYHSNLYGYWQSKWRLFTQNMVEKSPNHALIHNGIPLLLSDYERIPKNTRVVRYGHAYQAIEGGENATYRVVESTPQGQGVVFQVKGREWPVFVPLLGAFQISNLLGAVMAFECTGGRVEEAMEVLPHIKPVLGRMEHVCTYNQGHIYVDYAHTPQGLELALRALRRCTAGKLGVLFGCGGARDALKRPLMGQVAALHSDWVVVTDDNPRSEDPLDIRQHILVGCPEATSLGPRAAALQYALEALNPGDALLIAGKGHETTQILGDHVLEHSDQRWVREFCASRHQEL